MDGVMTRQPTPVPPNTTPEEWAWAAGLFEGEGCIFVDASGRRASFIVQMTDADVLRRFHKIVGVGTFKAVNHHRGWKANWKQQYNWRVGGYANLLMLAEKFRPWLGERRLKKLDDVLSYVPRLPNSLRKTHCKNGHPLSGEGSDVRVTTKFGGLQRVCRACHRLRSQVHKTKVRRAKADVEGVG